MGVQRYLQQKLGVKAFTAPFLNWCQMATFHKENDVQLLMGAPDMLIVPYEPMKLIVEIDLAHDIIHYFDRINVLQNLFPNYFHKDNT